MFPEYPEKGKKYTVNGINYFFDGIGFVRSLIFSETDPIYQKEKDNYLTKKEAISTYAEKKVEKVIPLLLKKTEADEAYAKKKDIHALPMHVYELKKADISWENDWIKIAGNVDLKEKRVVIRNAYAKSTEGTFALSLRVARANKNESFFYVKDFEGILSKNSNFEVFHFEFDLINDLIERDFHRGGMFMIRKENAVIEGSNLSHDEEVREAFNVVYKNSRRNVILEAENPLNFSYTDEAYSYYKVRANLGMKPYSGAAVDESMSSHADILKVAAHFSNEPIRKDITPASEVFREAVAVSAKKTDTGKVDIPTTIYFQSTYGFGVEFFESYKKEEIDARYPQKEMSLIATITAIDVSSKKITTSYYTWKNSVNAANVGDTVIIIYPDGAELTLTVSEVIDNQTFKVKEAVNPMPGSGTVKISQKVTIGRFNGYTPQQSPTCGIVGAKFAMIQDRTQLEWALCREAARMTASNSTVEILDGKKVYTTHWDMFRGYGIIDVEKAVEYLQDNYLNNQEYKDSAVTSLPRCNSMLSHKDLLPENYATVEMLRRLASVVFRYDRNLFIQKTLSNRSFSSMNGSALNISSLVGSSYLQPIKCNNGDKITVNINGSTFVCGLIFFDKEGNFINSSYVMMSHKYISTFPYTISVPENTSFIAYIFRYTNLSLGINPDDLKTAQIKIELSDNATRHMPAPEDLGIKID